MLAYVGDGIDPARASLWRRQLVLGPTPELCLLCDEPPAGVGEGRLPEGWSALMLPEGWSALMFPRETLFTS